MSTEEQRPRPEVEKLVQGTRADFTGMYSGRMSLEGSFAKGTTGGKANLKSLALYAAMLLLVSGGLFLLSPQLAMVVFLLGTFTGFVLFSPKGGG